MPRSTILPLLATLPLSLATALRVAALEPGRTIGPAEADEIRELVSPGVERLVRRGMELEIVLYAKSDDPPAFRAATEKYSAQVRLTPEGVLDESTYVAGLPFPAVDAADPQAGVKIAYNVERSRYFTDDMTLRNFDAITGSVQTGDAPSLSVERHYIFDTLRMLKHVGRVEQPPMPKIPGGDGVFAKAGQYPTLAPFDSKGGGGLLWRYLDAGKPDDVWWYAVSMRRVRRIAPSAMSDPGNGVWSQDIDVNSHWGFIGKIPWYSWRLVATKPMLAVRHGHEVPARPCTQDGGVAFCDSWEELPRMYVLEATPKIREAYSKRILFVDAETSLVAYTDLYGDSGELHKVAVNYVRRSTKPNPAAALEYERERDFFFGFVMVDFLEEHATRVSFPESEQRGDPGWLINQGDVGDDWFSTGALVAQGR